MSVPRGDGSLAWTPDDAVGAVYDVRLDGVWDELVAFYSGAATSRPLERIVEIARSHGVRSVVVEQRHLDEDWRGELRAFHGHAFRRHASVCHRWHLFTDDVSPLLDAFDPDSYRGYVVLRPIASTPVGRTMISPPPELADAVRCEVTEPVSLFGQALTVRSMPYTSQDAEYVRSPDAALWMLVHHAHLAHGLPRRSTAELREAMLPSGPSRASGTRPEGVDSLETMSAAAVALGLYPALVELPRRRVEDRAAGSDALFPVLRRYLDSQVPPVVASTRHMWLVVAYRCGLGDPEPARLWRHDDARGPYVEVTDPFDEPEDAHRPWAAALLLPPPPVRLDAAAAERTGRDWFTGRDTGTDDPVARCATRGELEFRTYTLPTTIYLEDLPRRGYDPDLCRLYRAAALPERIWVVEAVDRTARHSGARDVIGEVVVDATSTGIRPLEAVLIARAGNRASSIDREYEAEHHVDTSVGVVATGRPEPYGADRLDGGAARANPIRT